MKTPRNINASDLIRARRVSAMSACGRMGHTSCLTTTVGGTHHVTVPNHRPLKTGHLAGRCLEARGRAPQTLGRGIAGPTRSVVRGRLVSVPPSRNRRFCNL